MASQATTLNFSPLPPDIVAREWDSCHLCNREDITGSEEDTPCGAEENATPQIHLTCALAGMVLKLMLPLGDQIASVTYKDRNYTKGMKMPHFFTLQKAITRFAPDNTSREKLKRLQIMKYQGFFTDLKKTTSESSLGVDEFRQLILERLGTVVIDPKSSSLIIKS